MYQLFDTENWMPMPRRFPRHVDARAAAIESAPGRDDADALERLAEPDLETVDMSRPDRYDPE